MTSRFANSSSVMTENFMRHTRDNERMSPAFVLHPPLSDVQRAREEVCRQLSILRLQFNRHGCGEPTNLAAIFGG